MPKALVPIDGSANALYAVRHVIAEARKGAALELELLNVQPPLSWHIAPRVNAADRRAVVEEQATQALQAARGLLERSNVPYRARTAVGTKADVIADCARRLGCDRIVLSTRRKSTLLRLFESSTIDGVIEQTRCRWSSLPVTPRRRSNARGPRPEW
jgi:nucleotide-binding universal stress UspA family protein